MGPGLWSRLPMCPSFPPEEPCPPRPVSWQIVQGFSLQLRLWCTFSFAAKEEFHLCVYSESLNVQ